LAGIIYNQDGNDKQEQSVESFLFLESETNFCYYVLKNEYLLLCFENEYNFSTEILEC
jgi:hypothetical protein